MSDSLIGPFRTGLWFYADLGWGVVPTEGKAPPVKGYTGREGGWADRETYRRWRSYFSLDNVAIRVPPGFIGFDADLYKPDPTGRRAAFLESLDLPPTYRSTPRRDGSGISLYRVPVGMLFQANPAPGVELIQFHHRVVCCWPSVHPLLGEVYRWWLGDELLAPGVVPPPQDVAELPTSSIQVLKHRPPSPRQARDSCPSGNGSFAPVSSWWSPNVAATKCKLIVRKAVRAIEDGECRHDTACSATASLARWEVAGYAIATVALEDLGQAFMDAITTGPAARSTLAQANKEWTDLLSSGRALAHREENESE